MRSPRDGRLRSQKEPAHPQSGVKRPPVGAIFVRPGPPRVAGDGHRANPEKPTLLFAPKPLSQINREPRPFWVSTDARTRNVR
jgi:hypothetical protein